MTDSSFNNTVDAVGIIFGGEKSIVSDVIILAKPKSIIQLANGSMHNSKVYWDGNNSALRFYSIRKKKLFGIIPWFIIKREL